MCPVHDLSEAEISGASSTFFNFEIKLFFNCRKPKYLQNILRWHWRYFLNRFFIDNFPKITSKYLQNTRQFFIVWRLWNFVGHAENNSKSSLFLHTPKDRKTGMLKVESYKISLQGTISHLRKAGKSSSQRALRKSICYFPGGYPHPAVFSCSYQIRITVHYILNKNPSTKTWTAAKRIILGNKTPVQCKKSTMQTNSHKNQPNLRSV